MPFLFDDLFSNGFLATHGIDRDDRVGDVQHLQKSRNRRDFIALFVRRHLAQDKGVRLTPGTHHMDGCFVVRLIEAAPDGFAVDGNQLSAGTFRQRPHPTLKALFQLFRIQTAEDTPEGVMGGDPIRQREKGFEPLALRLAKQFDFRPFVGTANDCTNGDHQDIAERV